MTAGQDQRRSLTRRHVIPGAAVPGFTLAPAERFGTVLLTDSESGTVARLRLGKWLWRRSG